MTALTDAQMRAIAEEATAGPWRSVPWHIEEGPPAVRVPDGWLLCSTAGENDARHIATFDPPTVIALLDAKAKAEARVVDLQLALDVALSWLTPYEPGDSRAVSDGFVAMAAIACNLDDVESSRVILRAALATPDVGEV